MDPFSTTASAVTVAGLLGQSCLSIANFFRDFSQAPIEINHHHTAFRALHAGIRQIEALQREHPSTIVLTPEFAALLTDWLKDFDNVEMKLSRKRESLDKDKFTRTRAKIRWSLSLDPWLEKFLNRVQIYHSIFSTELMTILMCAMTMLCCCTV